VCWTGVPFIYIRMWVTTGLLSAELPKIRLAPDLPELNHSLSLGLSVQSVLV